MKETLEQEVYRLRNIIFLDFYGPPTQENWNRMKNNWIADIDWLREKAKHPLNLSLYMPDQAKEKQEIPAKSNSEIVGKVC